MKPATEKQNQARRGRACLFTSERYGCPLADLVVVEGIELRLCTVHEKRLRKIVEDAAKPNRRARRAA